MKLFQKALLKQVRCQEVEDKRQEELTVNHHNDTRVYCPAEMYIRLRLLPDRRFWLVIKFIDSHSHDLSSPDKVHHFYSHQVHQLKVSRTIMTNLNDVGMRPSNIVYIVNAMNHEED